MEADDMDENAQIYPKDMRIYKSCPVWDELILVHCRFCNSNILASSLKNHVDLRHTGTEQYEKDPEFSIFRKVVKKPTILSSTLTPRASSAAFGSRTSTSCSGDAFSAANLSPRRAEQFLGWPNSPHGAYQQSPLNMTTSKVVIPPGHCGKTGVSILAKNQKNALELSAANPMTKPEPYNQSFSFSSTPDIMPPSSTQASSRDMPSTSYEMPSTSYEMPSTSKGLFPCQPYSSETGDEGGMMYSDIPQSPSSACAASSLESARRKTPALEKIVLRRVLQTDPKAPADGSQSGQDLNDATNKRKASQTAYFMVVNKCKSNRPLKSNIPIQSKVSYKSNKSNKCNKSKDRQKKKSFPVKKQIRKKPYISRETRDQRMKRLKIERNKLIGQLFEELQCVKKKLDQCNRSKKEIEKELSNVKADLEETKRITDYRNEDLQKRNAEFENEIEKLKRRNEELTNTLESAQIYTQRLGHAWNFADQEVSKKFQTIEEQKIELQRRIEKLETESNVLKRSSAIERKQFDDKLHQYFKIITVLKKRYDEQVAKSQELKLQRDFYEKYLSPKISTEWQCQVSSRQSQPGVYEVYPGLLTPQSTPPISSPTIPLAEAIRTNSVNFMSYRSQPSPGSPEAFEQQQPYEDQQQEVIQDEDVS